MASLQTVEVILANDLSKHLRVPFTTDEPVYNIIQRIAIELQEPQGDYNYQELYLAGFHLEYPHLPLADYCVLGGTLTYQSFKKGDMSVFVRTLTLGNTLCIPCNPLDTVLTLKKILFRREGVPLAQLQLLQDGKILVDDKTLQSQGVDAMSTLTMLTRLPGGLALGFNAPLQFADVSDGSGPMKRKLYTNAPRGRSVSTGTNVEVNCDCTPRYQVICDIGFGTIELTQNQFTCPNCESSENTVPVTVGFWMCKYRFHGLKADGTQFTACWNLVRKSDKYQLFDPRKQTEWTRLVIESAPLDGEDDCSLCLERMVDYVTTLDCGHRFHEYCYHHRNSDSCSHCDFQDFLVNGTKYFSGTLRLRVSQ
ncbi:hypothetical protein BGX24_000955 [Mortierella sp. AD032]|nr:hypothetical protein BGX24_000955 [Mortierella sp. AD032]